MPPLPSADPWPPTSSWQVCLKALLLAPAQHIERVAWEGVYLRYAHHYVFLLGAVCVGWDYKLYVANPPDAIVWALVSGFVFVFVSAIMFKLRPSDDGMLLHRTRYRRRVLLG